MKRQLAWLLVGGVLVGLAGCGGSPMAPMKWQAKVVESNRELAKAGVAFREKLKPLEKGQMPSVADVSRARQDAEQALDKVRTEIDKITPPDSSAGEDFYSAYKEFLQRDGTAFRQEADKIMAVLQDKNTAPQAKWTTVKKCLDNLKKAESEALDTLKSKQKAFASEHKYQVMGGGGGMPMMGMP